VDSAVSIVWALIVALSTLSIIILLNS
jgi:hypothetical protein